MVDWDTKWSLAEPQTFLNIATLTFTILFLSISLLLLEESKPTRPGRGPSYQGQVVRAQTNKLKLEPKPPSSCGCCSPQVWAWAKAAQAKQRPKLLSLSQGLSHSGAAETQSTKAKLVSSNHDQSHQIWAGAEAVDTIIVSHNTDSALTLLDKE